jgi:hypothetical protein
MKNISLNIDKVAGFVSKETIAAYEPQVKACMETSTANSSLLIKILPFMVDKF